MRFRLHGDMTAAAGIGLRNHVLALAIFAGRTIAKHHASGWEIRTGNELHQVFDGDVLALVVAIDQVAQRIAHLAQVVRRDIGGHAHRDAAGAVDQQIGQGSRQHAGLFERAVEIVRPLDRILVDVVQHLEGNFRQPRLGVAHGRRVVAVDRAEVALAVDQGVTQAEVLCHAHHRLVNGRVAVRVILAQHLTDDACRLLIGLVGPQAQVVHGVENAAMHRLQPIAHVGQRARNDDAHRVIEIRRLHLCVNIDLLNRT